MVKAKKKERRRGRGREEEEKRRRNRDKKGMDSSKIWYGSLDFLYGILRFCMVNGLSTNLGFVRISS